MPGNAPADHDVRSSLALASASAGIGAEPQVADVVLPAFEQCPEDVALVELGVAGERDHPAGRIAGRHQALQTEIILPEPAGSQVGQISIEAARRIA